MLIDCPGCAKSYHISRATLGPQGRNVVCPHCLKGWFAAPGAYSGAEDADEGFGATLAQPDIDAEFVSERSRQPSYDELYSTQRRQPATLARAATRTRLPSAVALVPLAFVVVMSVIAFRATIVRFWPQANAFYGAAGFPVNARGLDLHNVHVNLVRNGTQPLLIVDGEIANLRDGKVQVPELRLAVRDDQGHEIYTWDAASPKTKLEGGETIAFRARLAAPPTDGHDVFVRFAAVEPKAAR